MRTVVVAAILLAVFTYASQSDLGVNKADTVVFTPATLPCSYTIIEHCNQTIKYEETSFVRRYSVNGDLFSFKITIIHPLISIFRTDLKFTKGGQEFIPNFMAVGLNKTTACGIDNITQDELDDQKQYDLITYLLPKTCMGVKEASFLGQKCKMYYIEYTDFVSHYFVDDNSYIIGWYLENSGNSTLASVSYEFDIPMEEFALNRTMYPGCNEKAYHPPKDQCHKHK